MYYYIIDPTGIPNEKFERLQVELQGLLSEFKLNGELARVSSLRTVQELVDTAALRGAKTLVACGNDDTFNQMLAGLHGKDFTLAFIPLVENTYLGKILGLENLRSAVKSLAGRLIEHIDQAVVGNTHFISYLQFGVMAQNLKSAGVIGGMRLLSGTPVKIQLRIDNSYLVEIQSLGGLIVNTRSTTSKVQSVANPRDGQLDLLIIEELPRMHALRYRKLIAENRLEELPHPTVIKCKSVEFLQPRGFALSMFGRIVTKSPATVSIAPQQVRLIVGKTRTF